MRVLVYTMWKQGSVVGRYVYCRISNTTFQTFGKIPGEHGLWGAIKTSYRTVDGQLPLYKKNM